MQTNIRQQFLNFILNLLKINLNLLFANQPTPKRLKLSTLKPKKYFFVKLNHRAKHICHLDCRLCGICIHNFKCSCSQNSGRLEFCVHIHLLSTAKQLLPHFAPPENSFYSRLEQLHPFLKNSSLPCDQNQLSQNHSDHSYNSQNPQNSSELFTDNTSDIISTNTDNTQQEESSNANTSSHTNEFVQTDEDDETDEEVYKAETIQSMCVIAKADIDMMNKISSKDISDEQLSILQKALKSIINITSSAISSTSNISLTDRKRENYSSQIIPQRGLKMPKKKKRKSNSASLRMPSTPQKKALIEVLSQNNNSSNS